MNLAEDKPLWTPSPARIASSNLTAFRVAAEQRWGLSLPDYEALYAWSVEQPEQFWVSVWEGAGTGGPVIGERGERVLVDGDKMPGASWFPDARLNFAQNLLRSRDAHDALVFWGEDRVKNRMSHGELYRAVARFAAALREQGVVAGDRVAAYMPNMPETLVAMLAAASIARSSLPLRPILAFRAYSIASARPSPRCWWPATAITTPARRSMFCSAWGRSSRSCPRSSAWSSSPMCIRPMICRRCRMRAC